MPKETEANAADLTPEQVSQMTPEQVSQMTDEQIDKGLGISPQPAEPAEALLEPSPKETPAKEPPPKAKAAEGEPPAQPAKKEPAQPAPLTAPAAQKEKLLAGKYKTTDDLGKGLLEIAKPLNYNPKVLETLVSLAKKTGDWAGVEQTYLELQDTLSKDKKAVIPEKEPPPKEDQLSHEATKEERQALADEMKVLLEEVGREMDESAVVREMKEQGIAIPKTREDFKQLKIDYPYYAREFNDQFMRSFTALQTEIADYNQALQTVEAHTTTARESAKQQIGEYNTEFGLKLDDAKIQAMIDEALKSNFVFEAKNGVQFVRENGIVEHFLAKQFPTLAKAIKTNGELDGRTQHLEDLDKMKKKTFTGISTSRIAPTRKEKAAVDLEDQQQIAGLSDEDIEKHLRGEA